MLHDDDDGDDYGDDMIATERRVSTSATLPVCALPVFCLVVP